MNEWMDKLGSAAKRAANTVSTQVSIAAEEQKIREAYQALGQLYFRSVRQGAGAQGPDFDVQCSRVEASLKRIEELKRAKDVTGAYADESDFVTVE